MQEYILLKINNFIVNIRFSRGDGKQREFKT